MINAVSRAVAAPKWRGILLTGHNVSGVKKMTSLLENAGHSLDETPRSSSDKPTFSVIDDAHLWDYGRDFHKLYVKGASSITSEQELWADRIVDAYDEKAMAILCGELMTKLQVKE